ncbi:MAG: hypothetical protein H0V10_13345 [Geodermatophilaceae bacterium]|nr:hypothetical protein [Geodermatophilaceae bacterium]
MNASRQLGIGSTNALSTAVPVVALRDVTAIAAGGSHACASAGSQPSPPAGSPVVVCT